jgi:RNA polymerase sigma-70 factor (ECF subfamily)
MVGQQGAEDLVQETYLRAWKYLDTFDPASNCRAWLFRILRNVWADRWARRRLEIPLAEGEIERLEPYYDWEGEFLDQHLSANMEQALSELPEEYRWAVLLADVEEFSYQEIAAILGCPIGTVMSRINRGRRMLARLLRKPAAERPGSGVRAAKDSEET